MSRTILFIIFTVLVSCEPKDNKQKASQKTDALKLLDLSVDSTLDSTIESSDIDTFKVDNRLFKINRDSDSKDITIVYFDNGKWNKNVDISVYDQLETTFYCNHDGYNDIYSQSQGWNYVNYYLPKQKLFSKQFQVLGDKEIIIDSSKGLYANYREPYHQCSAYNSQLIDYDKSVPTIHFLLSGETFYVNDECITDSIKIMKLFKYDEPKDSLILLESFKPKNLKKFEYELFWKKHYKSLMGYH